MTVRAPAQRLPAAGVLLVLLAGAARPPATAGQPEPPELVEPNQRLALGTALGLPRTHGFDLSPDGRRAVLAVAVGNRSSLFLAAPGAAPGELTRGTRWDSAPRFLGGGEAVVFVSGRRPRGLEREAGRLMRLRLGGEPEALTGEDLLVREPAVSPDGTRIAFLGRPAAPAGAADPDAGYDLFVLPAEGGTPERLTGHPGDEGRPVWSPDGRRIAYTFDAGLAGRDGANRGAAPLHSGLAVVGSVVGPAVRTDASEGPLTLLTDASLPPRGTPAGPPAWTPDGAALVWAAPAGEDGAVFDALHLLPADGAAAPYPLVTAEADLSRPVFRPLPPGGAGAEPEDRLLAWIADDGASRRLHRAAVRRREDGRLGVSGRVRVVTRGGGIASDPVWSADGELLAALHESAVSPRDLWTYPLAGGRERISDTLFPEADVRSFSRPEVLEVTAEDGFGTYALLYRPTGAVPGAGAPLLVHLAGPAGGGRRNGFDPIVQLLAERGYSVLAPNVRGGSGRGGAFAAGNDGDWGGGDLLDLAAAVRAAREREGIAPDRAGVFGTGYGGFLALAALARLPDLFACGIEAMGTADLVRLHRSLDPARRREVEAELGPLRGRLADYRRLSLVGEGGAVTAPLLSFHGEEVPEAPFAAKEPFLEELRRRADYPLVELYFRGDTGRSVFRWETDRGAAYAFLEKVFEFLSLHLPTD